MARIRKHPGYIGQLTTANGTKVYQDANGALGIGDSSGEILSITRYLTNLTAIDPGAGRTIYLRTSVEIVPNLYLNSKISYYVNLPTAGIGVSAVYKSSTQNAVTNAAPTTVSYTPPATAGHYRISGWVEVTTGTTIALKLMATYQTAGGNAVTDGVVFQQQGSITLLTAIVAAGRYYFELPLISVDNSATAITIADNSGTYTACVYNLAVDFEQLA
jgi:predicted aconitase with swiveling domain